MAHALHIVVRHRCNPHPSYPNQWLDDDRIRNIITYKEIADLCAPLIATAAPVRIHRAGIHGQPPAVCCEGTVQAVRPRGNLFEVEFSNARALHVTPTIRPDGKKSWHYAETGVPAPETGDSGSNAHASPSEPVQPNGDSVLSPPRVATPDSGPSDDRESRLPSKHLELLQRGTEDWNFARSNKPEVKPDLVGADLRGVLGKAGPYASVQLARADMRGANMAGLAFRNPYWSMQVSQALISLARVGKGPACRVR